MASKRGKNINRRLSRATCLSIMALLVIVSVALAGISVAKESPGNDKYPLRPIKVIVPAAAGGGLGSEIRTLAPFLEKNLGVRIVIDYITGADGLVAYNKLYQEKPDGYTILYFNLISAISLELTRDSAKYTVNNLSLISSWNVKYQVLFVPPGTWENFSDFVTDAKKRNLSAGNTGGHGILNYRLLESALGVKFNVVPYKSAGEVLAAVGGRHVDLGTSYEAAPKQMIEAGKIKALAMLSLERDAILPAVPDLKTLGYGSAPITPAYAGFAAPPSTAKNIVAKLENALYKSTTSPDFNEIAKRQGIFIKFRNSAEMHNAAVEQYNIVDKYKQFLKD